MDEAAAVQPPVPPVQPGLTLQEANLCLTREDIIDDSQKTDTHVTHVNTNTLFQNALSLLVNNPLCNGVNLLFNFNTFIDGNIHEYELLGRDLYKISIPYDVKRTVYVPSKNKIKKEMLVRIMEDLTQLEQQCAPFFFVKDNHIILLTKPW